MEKGKLKNIIIPVLILLIGGSGVAGWWGYQERNKSAEAPLAAVPAPPKAEEGSVWKYEKNITEPLRATSGQTDVTVGDLEQHKVSIAIAKGAFEADTEVQLSNPDQVPNYAGTEIDTIGAPIEISTGGPVRLNEKATVQFRFDPNALPAGTVASELRVGYYDGTRWEYIKPTAIDFAKGILTFEMYHFSLLGLTKIKDETTLTEEWIHSKTLDKQLRDNINKVTDHVANQIIDLGLEKMGITDKSLKGKILGEVLKENDYKDIYDSYQKGDQSELNQKLAVLVGKKMAENIPASYLQEKLKNLTADSDDLGSRAKDVAAVSQAAANIAEGRYKDAAEIIGEQIIDKTTIGIAGKIAVEVVKGQIDNWKNSEVEAAYEAFKHGANGVFYGYNVDKGDFDSVWDQMRGIRRQLEIEAIRKENEGREDAGLPPLSEAQMDLVRDKVKNSFKNQFTLRSEKEDQFKQQEDNLRLLVSAFKKANLLDSVMGPTGLDKGLDFENKLDVLNHFAEKMMADTQRFILSDKNGLIMDDKISVDDIAQGARIWFSGPNGRKDYQKFLKDRFNIDLYPKLSDLAGSWSNGKMVITDVIVPESMKSQPKDKADNELGCDFNMDLSKIKGKEIPITLSLTPQGETGGTLNFNAGDQGESKAIPFTYEDGVIKAAYTEKGATMAMELPASGEKGVYAIDGSLTITYKNKNGEAKILSTVTAGKSVGQKVPVAPAT